MFNRDDLQKLVNIAGHSLEIEDRFITGCVVTNPELYRDMRPGGILRINNERYYQFLITRNLMSGLPTALTWSARLMTWFCIHQAHLLQSWLRHMTNLMEINGWSLEEPGT